jgi:hypothetical protein
MSSPIEYPSVSIGGQQYFLKYTFADMRRAVREGQPTNEEISKFDNDQKIDNALKLAAVCLKKVNEASQMVPANLTVAEIEAAVTPGEYVALVGKVNEAISKAMAAPTQAQATTAQTEPTQIVQ